MWLSPNQDVNFWDFSFEEFGEYDLKACIEFIQKEKVSTANITLVGFSQGSMTAFFALSEYPDYFDKKVDLFIAIAPVV